MAVSALAVAIPDAPVVPIPVELVAAIDPVVLVLMAGSVAGEVAGIAVLLGAGAGCIDASGAGAVVLGGSAAAGAGAGAGLVASMGLAAEGAGAVC